jgi:cellulose synthase/poly-beta-1,6-N-acetylglucosamine synthase-like glycosyltransferase
MATRKALTIHKSGWLVLCPSIAWSVLVFFVIWPWMHKTDTLGLNFSILAHVSALIWWAVFLWALHHLAFQLASLCTKKAGKPQTNPACPEVALLYATCDDFTPEACKTCVSQDYRAFTLYVCDDSTQERYKENIREFLGKLQGGAPNGGACRWKLIDHPDKSGLKADNINYAIETYIQNEEWILLVDADQVLPSDYISKFVKSLPEAPHSFAFVQARQKALENGDETWFQKRLSPEISLYYERDLPLRNRCGFVPLLGHGAMIPRRAWLETNKFPALVSEDFAFALKAANVGFQGLYAPDVISYEAFPVDFGGFLVRLKKFAGGTSELLRRELISFLAGPAQIVEKWDFSMMLLWYVLMPLVTINGFLSSYVCHRLWIESVPYLHPALPYIYVFLLMAILILALSVTKEWGDAVRFYFWSTAVYTAAIPIVSGSFIKGLFWKARFVTTPKNRERKKLSILESLAMFILGAAAMFCSFHWFSPTFSPVLAGQAIAYLSFPLYGRLCEDGSVGRLARRLIYLPGTLMLLALATMWDFGRY